jgi:uncharacterized protein YndB with AHSA1/START domain
MVEPTGKVVRDAEGLQLIVERRLAASADEVWTWVTSGVRLKKWIGVLSGRPKVGATVDFRMSFEKDAAAEPVTVTRCEPARRLALEWGVGGDTWRVGLSLAQLGAHTTLYLSQRISDWKQAGSVGPGWEYYLDRLAAAHAGTAMPEWAGYETQRPYYERLAMDGEPVTSR